MANLINKSQKSESVNALLQGPWKTLRELTSKNKAKQIVAKSDNEILKWLSLVPGIELLKELGAYEAFSETFYDLDDVDDIAEMLEKFLVIFLEEPFKTNSNIQGIQKKLGPFEVYIPKSSREIFFLGVFMENCLKDFDQIEDYKTEKFLAALSFEGVPVICCKFEREGPLLCCTEALKRRNDSLEPYEQQQVMELEKAIAKKIGLSTLADYELNKEFIDEKIKKSMEGRRGRRNQNIGRETILEYLEKEMEVEKEYPLNTDLDTEIGPKHKKE